MNPNTFKKGDSVRIFGGETILVNYITGPYVAYTDKRGYPQTAHYTNCTLVENKFGPGDIVRHPRITDAGLGTVLDLRCGEGNQYSVQWAGGGYGQCRDYASNMILVSRANAVTDFIKAGKMIDAIKEYRTIHGTGLKESKDAVEALRDRMKAGKFDDGGPYNEPQTLGDILAAALNKNKFKVGDKVVTDNEPDDVGTVRGVKDGRYAVQFPSQSHDCSTDYIWNETELAIPQWKFKVGDTVKGRHHREEYLISDVRPADGFFFVKKYPLAGYSDPQYFELVAKVAIVPTIVVRHDVGKGYRPNDNPRVHNTAAEATAEAERLAKLNPGVKFDTFTLVTSSVATAPVEATVTTVKA